MRSGTYYNEIDPVAAEWLRQLIAGGHIAPGDVDTRSITEVTADDIRGYRQVHLFAGIGGWSYALRLAGWPDDRPVWTGSCPCQPFSAAGKRKGTADARHLWPEMFRLIRECRPATVFGEQVAAAIGHGWLDGVFADMEAEGYACGAAVLGAHSVGAPHIRQRLWWVADADYIQRRLPDEQRAEELETQRRCTDGGLADAEHTRPSRAGGDAQHQSPFVEPGDADTEEGAADRGMADTESKGRCRWGQVEARGYSQSGGSGTDSGMGDTDLAGSQGHGRPVECAGELSVGAASWSDFDLIPCTDGKTRRVESGTFPLADGVPGRVGLLRGYGNAIVPQVAAEFIRAATCK